MSTKKPAKDEGHSKRDLTIQFCDISGFTNLADKMSPTEVAAFLSEYFDHMNEIISKYKGTFEQDHRRCVSVLLGSSHRD